MEGKEKRNMRYFNVLSFSISGKNSNCPKGQKVLKKKSKKFKKAETLLGIGDGIRIIIEWNLLLV